MGYSYEGVDLREHPEEYIFIVTLTAVLIGWILLPLVGLWAMIDAYMTARRNNERYGFM